MSILFCTFVVEIRTRYNKLSALPKHGNRHTMLQLIYSFLDPADNQKALDTISEFMQKYSCKDNRAEIFSDKLFVYAYELSCAYDAMQLINAIDVILNSLDSGFTLEFIHYTEYFKK